MKKLALTILTLLSSGAAYALPVGNPTEASLYLNGILWESCSSCHFCDPCFSWCDAWSFRAGFCSDFVFNRHLKAVRPGDIRDSDNGRHVQDVHLATQALYVVLNFCDKIDIFTTLGSTEFWFRTNSNVFQNVAASVETEFHFGDRFSWSLGGRATIWECGCFGLGLETQYFSVHPELDYFVDYGSGQKIYFDHIPTHYREWQVALGVTYRIATNCPTLAFVPYTAAKWSRSRFEGKDAHIPADFGSFNLDKFRLGKHWGWVLGLSLTMCDMIGVTAEGRYGDEKALYINAQIRI